MIYTKIVMAVLSQAGSNLGRNGTNFAACSGKLREQRHLDMRVDLLICRASLKNREQRIHYSTSNSTGSGLEVSALFSVSMKSAGTLVAEYRTEASACQF